MTPIDRFVEKHPDAWAAVVMVAIFVGVIGLVAAGAWVEARVR